MAIPKNITRENIKKAIKKIIGEKVPKRRKAKKYLVEFNGIYFPPKYTISVANKYANGKELNFSKFNGGKKEANDFLKKRGFKIVKIL